MSTVHQCDFCDSQITITGEKRSNAATAVHIREFGAETAATMLPVIHEEPTHDRETWLDLCPACRDGLRAHIDQHRTNRAVPT